MFEYGLLATSAFEIMGHHSNWVEKILLRILHPNKSSLVNNFTKKSSTRTIHVCMEYYRRSSLFGYQSLVSNEVSRHHISFPTGLVGDMAFNMPPFYLLIGTVYFNFNYT